MKLYLSIQLGTQLKQLDFDSCFIHLSRLVGSYFNILSKEWNLLIIGIEDFAAVVDLSLSFFCC